MLCRRRRRFGIDEQQVGGGVWAHHAVGQQRITRRAALRRPRLARRVFDLVFDVAAAAGAAAVRRLSVAGERRGREGEQAGRRRGWSDHQLGRLRVSTLGRDARTCNDERTAGRSQNRIEKNSPSFPGFSTAISLLFYELSQQKVNATTTFISGHSTSRLVNK